MSYPTEAEQHPFFFYGTLRRGQENYTLLRWRTLYEQPARAASMSLYSLKQFPIMTTGGGYVYGDLMILQPRLYDELLRELDYLEGYDENNPVSSMLRRVLIPVELESGRKLLAWGYTCNQRVLAAYPTTEQVMHGDWDYYKKRLLIEARFGSYDEAIHGTNAATRWAKETVEGQDITMPQSSIFQWRDGAGWLVLVGHGEFEDSDTNGILAEALSRTISPGPLAYIYAAGDEDHAERDLELLADMGSPTGYLVDVIGEDNDSLKEQIEQAGIIILGDGEHVMRLRDALEGVVHRSLLKAFQSAATIIGIGAGATVLGQWLLDGEGQAKPGFSWLKGAMVVVEGNNSSSIDTMHDFLREYPKAYGVGINPGAATAFSPTGALEVWGNQQITVALGKDLTHGE